MKTEQEDRDRVARFVERATALKLHPRPRMLAHYLPMLFRGVRLEGADVLDIGGGTGVLGLFAGWCGAASVLCLEPEAAGSHGPGTSAGFAESAAALGVDHARLEHVTLQEFEAGDRQFDLLLLNDAVNHLDEPACIELRRSVAARRSYEAIFARLARLARPGAALLLADVSPVNFWPLLGLRNPLVGGFDWHKHQPPGVWVRLLREQGFALEELSWSTPSSLGRPGRLLLGNALGAFFFSSHFRLRLRRTR